MNNKKRVRIGLERLLNEQVGLLRGARVGVLCNQASVDGSLRHAADLFKLHSEVNLVSLFGPQHGIRGDVQDNMIETGHGVDRETGIPVYSLYSETREPTDEMLNDLDILVCDLQDVGCRVYTFIYTLANCMKAAGRLGKKIIVCDRPNPINGVAVEGNVLEPEFASFVGQYPIPMRHGLTIGELALLFKKYFAVECDLEIVKMDGWEREFWFDETTVQWVMPSPNMPTIETAAVFPGTVFFEGTQISEGRGTTRPFELIGAPYIDAAELTDFLNNLSLPGVYFRASNFQPTFQKHAKTTCGGVQIHVLERDIFEPVKTGIAIISAIYELYRADFRWKNPPYEYVHDRNPFDVIAGTGQLRAELEAGGDFIEINKTWNSDLRKFELKRKTVLLY